WIADGPAARSLWRRALPVANSPQLNPVVLPDDSMIIGALNSLPAVDLPPTEQLFLLLAAYIVLIGPVNYLVLRRLDRREWAWLTMPALVAIFALVSYGIGAALKGSDVIVNQIAIVRAGEGTERGLGQVYVGVYSPSRRTFDVRIAGGAMLSNPISQTMYGGTEQPLDVIFGAPSRLRNFEVGFGVLRGFRADAPADVPLIESDLRLVRGRLQGTITNRSDEALENVAVVLAGGVAAVPRLDAGASHTFDVDIAAGSSHYYQLSERIFGSSFPRDPDLARTLYTRRAVIDQVTGYGPNLAGSGGNPVLVAWRSEPVLDIEITGEQPNHVGDTLIVMALPVTLDAQAVFSDRMMRKTIIDATAGQAWGGEDSSFSMGRGTMTVEVAPANFDGSFDVDVLELALTQGEFRNLRGTGTEIAPLPDEQQPDQDDPLKAAAPTPLPSVVPGSDVDSDDAGGGEPAAPAAPVGIKPSVPEPWPMDGLPELQLFDRQRGLWLEFEHLSASRSYVISEPERYVDDGGRLLVRFVYRGQVMDGLWFQFLVRMEGTIR
ncbi:MAG TPA: hypothetical protein VNW68_00775, partial [Candidatus Limnocylindria bacterium]|nr:hypothetical protein [Candidatus Limnocylindria bacterium]